MFALPYHHGWDAGVLSWSVPLRESQYHFCGRTHPQGVGRWVPRYCVATPARSVACSFTPVCHGHSFSYGNRAAYPLRVRLFIRYASSFTARLLAFHHAKRISRDSLDATLAHSCDWLAAFMIWDKPPSVCTVA